MSAEVSFPGVFIEETAGPQVIDDVVTWNGISVRKLLDDITVSIVRDTDWVVFEANTPALWDKVRGQAEEILLGLFRRDVFPGTRPADACYVRCDRNTMTQADIDDGRLIIEIGVAPLRPAEFVIIRIGRRLQRKR